MLIAAVSWLLAGSSVVTIVSRLLAVGCLLVAAAWRLLVCPITTMSGSVWVLIVAVSGLLAGCWWLAGGCCCLGAGSWSRGCWVSSGKSSQAKGEHTKGVVSCPLGLSSEISVRACVLCVCRLCKPQPCVVPLHLWKQRAGGRPCARLRRRRHLGSCLFSPLHAPFSALSPGVFLA